MTTKTRKNREKLGRRAERIAAIYLQAKGYKILERRFKTRQGEIDIIALKHDILVFVEVKARADLTKARDSISYHAQQRIMRAASSFVGRKTEYQKMGQRFDAIFLLGGFRIKHEPDFWS